MKAATKKTSVTTYPLGATNVLQPDEQNDDLMNFTNFTVPNQLAEQPIAPPSHVWDKIAGILDAQERHKMLMAQGETTNHQAKNKSSILLISGSACVVLAVFIWMLQ